MPDPINSVRLSKETLIQLSALALPGESIASVVQRAALALQTLENANLLTEPEPRSIDQRLDAIESRLGRIERYCEAQASRHPDAT